MRAPHLPLGHANRREWLYGVAIVLPPAAVYLIGETRQVPVSILLSMLFWIPGVVHAIWRINRHTEEQRLSETNLLQAMRNHVRR